MSTFPSRPDVCAFCRVIAGRAEALEVFSDEVAVAILDRRPLFPGHVLLLPRGHYQTLADVPSELVGPLFTDAQLLQLAVEKAMGAEGAFVGINNRVSQSIPHLHIHIVPRRRGDGLKGFFWPRHSYPDEAAALEVQLALREAIARLRAGAD